MLSKNSSKDEVISFIKNRFSNDCNWTSGNCYWFSLILINRFPQLEIYLFPIENHFMAGNGEKFYDWNGIRLKEECEEQPIKWKEVKQFDELYYNRLIRDCVN